MKLSRMISDILIGQNSVLKNDQINIINSEILTKTNYLPICKKTVAYIVSIILINDNNITQINNNDVDEDDDRGRVCLRVCGKICFFFCYTNQSFVCF